MTLKYVGPKPIISHTGIDFDNNKEDKFAYLNIAVQLLKALDHEYFKDKSYRYHADTSRLSSDELLKELQKYCPNLETLMKEVSYKTTENIEHEIQRIQDSSTLKDEDKEVHINNINLMYDYIVQRAINKDVYYCAINSLAKMVQKDQINYVITPMFQTFAHVLHSIQGVLFKSEFTLDTKIDIYQEDGKLLVKLKVLNN